MEGSLEEQCQLSVGFNLRSARDAKRLWRCSVEFHMFYRFVMFFISFYMFLKYIVRLKTYEQILHS